jgi:hypothetical protein
LHADSAGVTLSGSVSNGVNIVELSLSSINVGTDVDVINGSITGKTSTFTVKSNSNAATYDVWLTADNYDTVNDVVYAAYTNGGTTYRFPIIVTLSGSTSDTGVDGQAGSGAGSPVSVYRTIAQNDNLQVSSGAGKSAGEDVWGTNVNGTVYTITVDQVVLGNYPYSNEYINVPAGTYTVTITANVLVTN